MGPNIEPFAVAFRILARMFETTWHIIVAALLGTASAIWMDTPEGIQRMLIAAGIMFVCDVVSGSIRAWRDCDFSSDAFGRSLVKSTVYCISLIAAYAIDLALDTEHATAAAISTLIFLRESTSVIENTAALGFPWPDSITDKLSALRKSHCKTPGGDLDGTD